MQPTRLTGAKPPAARVLIVDDEESICSVLARMIAPLGYVVDVALDAEAALVTMLDHPAHVALVDIRMPGHDGIWLIQRLQKSHPDTAIVIVTGIVDLDPRVTLRPGVIGYLTKPFDTGQVQDVVAKAVAQVRSSRAESKRALGAPLADEDIPDLHDLDDQSH